VSDFLSLPAPRWLTIAAHRPFVGDLAAGIWRALGSASPDALADATILLPNRRAVRALAEALVAASGQRAILLPNMRALGDLDEGEPPFEPGDLSLDLPPAISPQRRRFELAGIVAANQDLIDRELTAVSALDLADALAAFLDACQIEEVGEIDLDALVEGDLALHWRQSAAFLKLATEAWPARLAELGLMDLTARRVALLRRLQARGSQAPPAGVLIAAGSTGSTPATADLLAAIARAPRGCVVLPGLDLSLADTAWAKVGDQHPQGALKRLLDSAGIARAEVRPWAGSAEAIDAGRWRRRIVSEALRPADETADWLSVIGDINAESPTAIAQGLAGLTLMSARSEDEAAAAAALMLREALETPERTAALITPDAALARRVVAALARWNVTPDSSVGVSLAASPLGVLASLVARQGADPVDPVTLLAIVKHPLTRLGLAAADLDRARRDLERQALRGPCPGSWDALRNRLAENDPALDLATRLESALALAQPPPPLRGPPPPEGEVSAGVLSPPWGEGRPNGREGGAPHEASTPASAARALAQCLEALAAGPDGQPALWAGQAGESVGAVIASLIEDAAALPPVTPAGFRDLLDGLLTRGETRPGGASHPRLKVLGVLEARLVRSDLTILAGLEEGTWPTPAPIDPFLSRPMRTALGLPAPERRIGLSAHDFAQGACAPEVVLLASERRGGSPAVPSRWLWRLRTLIAGARLEAPNRPQVLAWARALDAPLADPAPSLRTAVRPRPAPPLAARPRELPVTAVETWIRDPYAVYARRILRLRRLDPPDAPVEAMVRGSAIHKAFERLAGIELGEIDAESEAVIAALIHDELTTAGMPRARMAREIALAANVAPWVLAFERRRRPGARLLIEQSGRLEFDAPGGPFAVTARADRIEAREGLADILDFKTGRPPGQEEVEIGLAPQLTLTAAILAAGGFADLGPLSPGQLLYVRVTGGRKPGEELARGGEDSALPAAKALAGLKRRVARFDDPAAPYVSWAIPKFTTSAGDYDHLARVWEWRVIGESETGE
jgi:ATP-dependent helicase/nuclease subunit B